MKLKDINYSVALLCLSVGKILITGATLGDAIAVAALAGLYGFTYYLESKKELPINDQVKSELEQMRSAINGLKISKTFSKIN